MNMISRSGTAMVVTGLAVITVIGACGINSWKGAQRQSSGSVEPSAKTDVVLTPSAGPPARTNAVLTPSAAQPMQPALIRSGYVPNSSGYAPNGAGLYQSSGYAPHGADIYQSNSTTLIKQTPVFDRRVASYTSTTSVPPNSSTTVVQNDNYYPSHRYVRKVTYYRNDKIHLHRAVKHGAMFLAKLPGRLRL